MINILLDFIKNAGNYLIQHQTNIKPLLHKDSSVVSVVTHAYHVYNPFCDSETKTQLLPTTESASPIAFANQYNWAINNETSTFAFFNYFSAVSQCFYTLVGTARAYCMKTRLWDIAGTIPIANYLGINIYEYGTKKICNCISPEYFNTNMRLKNYCIICHPNNYEEIARLVTPK